MRGGGKRGLRWLGVLLGVTASCAKPPGSSDSAPQVNTDLGRLESECNAGAGAACNELGERYARAKGAPFDPDRAIARFKRGCELDHPVACSYLGALMGAGRGMPKDVTGSIELLRRGCSRGVGFACGCLGRVLMQEFGREREGEALLASGRGCELGHRASCSDLATVRAYPPLEETKDAQPD